MLKNLLRTTFRYFIKYKAFTLTNVFGLAIGLATCILIFLFVLDELKYDKFHQNADRIYRLEIKWTMADEEGHWAATSGGIIPEMTSRYPEVEKGLRLMPSYNSIIFKNNDKEYSEDKVFFVDSTFFDVFSFELIKGSKKTALSSPENIVVSESHAKKYFGHTDVIGKVLKTEKDIFKVSAVMKDMPEHSHFHCDVIIPLSYYKKMWKEMNKIEGPSVFYSYILLHKNNDVEELRKKLIDDIYTFTDNPSVKDSIPEGFSEEMLFQALTDIHLKGHAEKEMEANSDIQYVYIFIIIALFVLIIACINYMNLATARSGRRVKEIGMRKIVGASRRMIFLQFISESFILCIFSSIIALVLVELVLPFYIGLTGKHLSLNVLVNPIIFFGLLVVIFIVGLLSGSYPAFYLSRINPLKVIRSDISFGKSNKFSLYLRRILVLLQFSISVFLIICTITVYKQLMFINNKDLGFDKENVLVIPTPIKVLAEKKNVLKNEFLKNPGLAYFATTACLPGERVHVLSVRIPELEKREMPDSQNEIAMRVLSTSDKFIETMGIQMSDGRSFSDRIKSDITGGFIINESAVKALNLKDPVGKEFYYTYNLPEPKKGKIIGVIKDYHYISLHSEVDPQMIHIFPQYCKYICLKLKSGDIKKTINGIERSWNKNVQTLPFSCFMLEDFYDNIYVAENNMGVIVSYFTILTILIACLGLLGLISFITEQRKKEVAIRKVLGAPVISIMKSLTREYFFLILIANIIAGIPAYLFLENWLQAFAFRVDIGFLSFILTAVLSLLIALITVSIITIGAARRNPADSLSR